MDNNTLAIVLDCCRLSSGTLATLTGQNTYEKIDAIHAEFVNFVQQFAADHRWHTWVDAWQAFDASR